MKSKIHAFFIFLLLLNAASFAQNTDLRSVNTRIADLLSQVPAFDSSHWNSNMADMAVLCQKGGLPSMMSLLSPPGTGNNSRLEYAISGFSSYVMKPGNENFRKLCVEVYCQVLDKLTDRDNQAFIISQLGLVGNDEAVAVLKKYISVKELCDPTCQALVKINTASAKEALLENLQNAKGDVLISLIQAMGDCKITKALPFLHTMVNYNDASLLKVSYCAIAAIGDPTSDPVLFNAARKSSFHFGPGMATFTYINYLQNLAANGHNELSKTRADWILANCVNPDQISSRIGALRVYSKFGKDDCIPVLIKASKDQNSVYREAALRFSLLLVDEKNAFRWTVLLKNVIPAVRASIIRMLGLAKIRSAAPVILTYTDAADREVRLAALSYLGQIDQTKALDKLIDRLRTANMEELEFIKNTLQLMHGKLIDQPLGIALSSMPSASKIAIINVLDKKGANSQFRKVYPFLSNNDNSVVKAAFQSLRNISDYRNLDDLFALLRNTSDTSDLRAVQSAIIQAIDGCANLAQKQQLILNKIFQSTASDKWKFYSILAGLGGTESLRVVTDAFLNGDATEKKYAINALVTWKDAEVENILYKIAKKYPEYANIALAGYLRAILSNKATEEQRVLQLDKGLSIARTANEQSEFIKEAGKMHCFSALVFAGRYLDNPDLEQVAASAVMNITLGGNTLFPGKYVSELLSKVQVKLKGADSEYQRESIRKALLEIPENNGFVPLFNGKDLAGWTGYVGNPIERGKMTRSALEEKQKTVNEDVNNCWKVINGVLVYTGKGNNLVSEKKYGDFEMLIDWRLEDDGNKNGDGGIYLRGTPQVQIWDTSRRNVGAGVGSGGLYNNKIYQNKPLVVADNPLGEWNTFRILITGDTVTVYLNGVLVTDHVKLENYWQPGMPLFAKEFIELQAHGSKVSYRNIFVREIIPRQPFELSEQEKKEGYSVLFDGTNLENWVGNKTEYVIENGNIVIRPIMAKGTGSGGNLYTKQEYSDFNIRFEFRLTAGANNGLGVRAPLQGDAAYLGMEIQILDNDAEIYKNLHDYQFHGSVYGVIPAKRGFLKPVGEWNFEEVIVKGNRVKVILNNTIILDGDIAEASANGTIDHLEHPGLQSKKGHIGFLGHGAVVWFRNVRIKEL